MKKTDAFYHQFEADFISWANQSNDIRAAFVVGSRSRVDYRADEWSDLDIIIYANNHGSYLSTTDWLQNIGKVWLTYTYRTSRGEPERLTLFEGGFQVDIVFLSSHMLAHSVKERIIPDIFWQGVRVLVDKDNISQHILPPFFKQKPTPSINQPDFTQFINMFWFTSMYTAKQILRGELWVTKMKENEIKTLLLQMMEWHAKALHGQNHDVWYGGRFLDEWVDHETFNEIKNAFGHFEKNDSLKALVATMNLFRRLATEVAGKLQLRYPTEADKNITHWITQIEI